MRLPSLFLVALLVTAGSGCTALEQYTRTSRHFGLNATVDVRQYPADKTRMTDYARDALKNQQYAILSEEVAEETSRIRATKDGRTLVVDIESTGVEGSTVRMEVDEVGSDGMTWELLNLMEALIADPSY